MRSYSLDPNSIRELFDSVAPSYDLLNHLLSLRRDAYWRKRAVREISSMEGWVIDIATGTGDLAMEVVRQGPEKRKVIGLDFSEPMLRRANQKVARRRLKNMIGLSLGDALHLPFRNDTFEAALIAFGLRNIPEKEKALSEMTRVIKPGGKVVVLEFTIPRIRPVKEIYSFYFLTILPRIGGLVSGNRPAYSYLPDSVFRFHSAHDYEQLMRRIGLQEVTSCGLTFGIASIMVGAKGHR